jgi:hypothetical protein
MPDMAYYGPAREIVQRGLEKAEVFAINNVATYFFEELKKSNNDLQRWRVNHDFPNLAPPFENFWMEYAVHPSMFPFDVDFTSSGALFCCVRLREDEVIDYSGYSFSAKDGVGWFMRVFPFALKKGGLPIGPLLSLVLPIHQDGSFMDFDPDSKGRIFMDIFDDTVTDDGATHISKITIYPGLLALSFLHCKNVTVITGEPSRAFRRRAERENRPLVAFKTLDILPMRTILSKEGHSETEGLRHALHICRGHFADYTNGNGLFGKYHGKFWIQDHVRGAKVEGIVSKDYKVNPPVTKGA